MRKPPEGYQTKFTEKLPEDRQTEFAYTPNDRRIKQFGLKSFDLVSASARIPFEDRPKVTKRNLVASLNEH